MHKFVYEFRGNNTYIIQDRTALMVFFSLGFQGKGNKKFDRTIPSKININLMIAIGLCLKNLNQIVESIKLNGFVRP